MYDLGLDMKLNLVINFVKKLVEETESGLEFRFPSIVMVVHHCNLVYIICHPVLS